MSQKGTLYLIPTTLGKTTENNSLPGHTLDILRKLEVLVVENIQTTVRYLQWVENTIPEYKIDFNPLNKNTPDQEIFSFLKPLKQGKDVGLLSEAGVPAVADPGSKLVLMAHQNDIRVVPLVGPSSILLALMGSGFNGQQFTFHGYLPRDEKKRADQIRQLENESRRHDRTQIFMEAPHRNNELFKTLLNTCTPETRVCVAMDLTLPDEFIKSKRVSEWQAEGNPDLHKRPVMFLIYAR